MIDRAPIAATAGTLTPCCDRVPLCFAADCYVCRGCGQVFTSVRAMVEARFGGCADVTPLTPSRLIVRQRRRSSGPGG